MLPVPYAGRAGLGVEDENRSRGARRARHRDARQVGGEVVGVLGGRPLEAIELAPGDLGPAPVALEAVEHLDQRLNVRERSRLQAGVEEPALRREHPPRRLDRLDRRPAIPGPDPLDCGAGRLAPRCARCQSLRDLRRLPRVQRLPLRDQDGDQAVGERESRIPDRVREVIERHAVQSLEDAPGAHRPRVVLFVSDHVGRKVLARESHAVGRDEGRGVRIEEEARGRVQDLREIRERMIVPPLRPRVAAVDRLPPSERGIPPRDRGTVQVPDVPVRVGVHEVHVGDRQPADCGLELRQRLRADHGVELREPAAVLQPRELRGEGAALPVQPHDGPVVRLPEAQGPILPVGDLHRLRPRLGRSGFFAVAVDERRRRVVEPLDVQVADIGVVVRVGPAEPRVVPHVWEQEPEAREPAELEPLVAVEVDLDVALDAEERLVRVDEEHRRPVRRPGRPQCPLVRSQRDVAQRAA